MRKKKYSEKIFSRYNVFYIALIAIFAAISMKLYNLQIVRGAEYCDIVNNTTQKVLTQSAPRGTITDKNGVVLATNEISYRITYIETEESKNQFFTTMSKVFKILDANSEPQIDDFQLKLSPLRFDFNTDNPDIIKKSQLRFLKDRGLQGDILKNKEFAGKNENILTDAETQKLNDELLKYTPTQVFNKLVAKYEIDKGLKSAGIMYSQETARKYMLIKDKIQLQSFSNYNPIIIADNINRNTAVIFWQELNDMPGINVDTQPLRVYPKGQLASSVLGYIGKIDSSKKDHYEERGYDASTDYIGKAGIEAALENELKGEKGEDIVKIDKYGRIKSQLFSKDSYPGYNVQLTIDSNLQYAAETALDKQMLALQKQGIVGRDAITKNATRSAAVAIDINTGAVLALASRPGFDPNDFANPKGLSTDAIKEYFNNDYEAMAKAKGMDQEQIDFMFPIDTTIPGNKTIRYDRFDFFPKRLYNYATMSLIPPGSTFKPLTAVAGLETGVIDQYKMVDDEAVFNDENNFKAEFKSDGPHGPVNVVSAIGVSSNPYFMTVGKLLRNSYGEDIIAKYAWQFGLGYKPGTTNWGTGIEITENYGQVYNTQAQIEITTVTCIRNIESYLSNGNDPDIPGYFKKLDLYPHNNDSSQVTSIKNEIINDLKSSIKTGVFQSEKDKYRDLLKKLVAADVKYKGQTFTKSDYDNMLNVMYYQAISNGYYLLKLPANMYNASIGQGINQFTPLELVNYIATLVNGGNRYKLHLVDKVTDASGKVIEENKPTVLNKVALNSNTIQLVKQGMEEATGDNGTAAAAFAGFPIKTGGKTGTAQFNADMQAKIGRSSYAFYVGYAPIDNPKIAVVAVIFEGGYGFTSADVVKGIYESYFKEELKNMNYTFTTDVDAKP